MNKLQRWLGEGPVRFALILFFSVSVLQVCLIPAGLETWFGLHWMQAVLAAALLGWVPVAGQVFAIAAAVDAWNWPPFAAAIVFLWPVWLIGGTFVGHWLRGRRRRDEFLHRTLDAARHNRRDAPDNAGEPDAAAGWPLQSA